MRLRVDAPADADPIADLLLELAEDSTDTLERLVEEGHGSLAGEIAAETELLTGLLELAGLELDGA